MMMQRLRTRFHDSRHRWPEVPLVALIWTSAFVLTVCVEVTSTKMHHIYWNTTNPMFRIDNTDNIIDVNIDNLPWEYDQANIICPQYRRGTRAERMETYIIHNVSREEYEKCEIVTPHPRVIAVCNKPHELIYFTITFRSFTPTPGGLEFLPGKDYYFISTSARNDLYARSGGRCISDNMRVVFKVAAASQPMESQSDQDVIAVNVPRHRETMSRKTPDQRHKTVNTEIVVNDDLRQLSDFNTYLYPMRDVIEVESNAVEHDKRSHNDVMKQASMMRSSSVRLTPSHVTFGFLVAWQRLFWL